MKSTELGGCPESSEWVSVTTVLTHRRGRQKRELKSWQHEESYPEVLGLNDKMVIGLRKQEDFTMCRTCTLYKCTKHRPATP